jgi:hypothetical protein
MRELPASPDLDQLRRQARELQRTTGTTLALAQLAIAREHGFASWARLKAELARRRTGAATRYEVRPVESLEELKSVFDFVGARSAPSFTPDDRRYLELAACFPEDRSLMLVLRDRGRIAGALLACSRGEAVTPRAVAVALPHPPGEVARTRDPHEIEDFVGYSAGEGGSEVLLTRLLQALEVAAVRLGAEQVYEGGVVEPRQLYERLGYRGRNPMVKHLLPLPGRARDRMLRDSTLEGRSP